MDKKTLKEITEDSPCRGEGFCILREAFTGVDNRTALQMRCMIDYRYILGTKLNREPTNEETFESWVKDGYAEKYAQLWEEYKTYKELKKRLFQDEN